MEERISVVGGDGSTRDAVARMEARLAQRAHYEELDWQQRQRAMVVQRGTPTVSCGYGGYCGDQYTSSSYDGGYYPAYYTPYSYGGRVFTAGVPRPGAPSARASPRWRLRPPLGRRRKWGQTPFFAGIYRSSSFLVTWT